MNITLLYIKMSRIFYMFGNILECYEAFQNVATLTTIWHYIFE